MKGYWTCFQNLKKEMLTFKRIIKSRLDETEYNLRNRVKKCTIFLLNVLEFSKCDLIKNITQLL